MEGFDDPGLFFSDNFGGDDAQNNININLQSVKKKFKDFLRQFHEGNFNYKYRAADVMWLAKRAERIITGSDHLAHCDRCAIFARLGELTVVRDYILMCLMCVKRIQNTLVTFPTTTPVTSSIVSQIVKIPGIVVSASGIRAKATKIAIQCRSCQNVIPDLNIRPGLDGYVLPRKCNTEQAGRPKCPLDPYFIIPDKCKCVDFQTLKLQELNDSVPQGEMPRHVQLFMDRYLCDKVVPGNRVIIIGIYCIKKVNKARQGGGRGKESSVVGVRSPYLRVVGYKVEAGGIGSTSSTITADEEDYFRRLAASPNIHEKLAQSIAPSIFGSADIKKALACLLFGGSRKRMPDGLTRRGDINVLLLGDPGTAKSQLLKFIERVSPVGVYTSGKGSSAAGLTASVNRDPVTRNFVMEGGAMVLADGGVVCIDEFDKMREDDRVAIHEAMEQQTISIAKAGITTTLNSRCSVLAAANSVFGRWDDTKGEENIDFMPTILSRFDMIFIVKDEHDEGRDSTLAKHIMNVHMTANQAVSENQEGELSLQTIKKFINYCRKYCGPRLSEAAGEKLKNRYVLMRSGTREHEIESEKRMTIPITVRQLEAVIRISESLAKMQLSSFATESHVDEALRLFQVSTLDAAMSGTLAGAEGFTTEEDHEMLIQIEKQLKRRFAIGSQVAEHNIVQDFLRQKYPERAIYKVIMTMIRRGELQHRSQRKVLYRMH
ncbi:DNA replication licensing factor Mcm5 [Nilaparvata lugens]|uniref:DNA replication licensing factor Mcm5 n=1 Tax=Nilaparvata lugens TaxID=108931 RepID=UPI00193DF81C|nr:DNA replication licensing factor Mcm5 [Nilaparvata lugens]